MALSVPYHPYGGCCLNCGQVPEESEHLRKCSGCKTAPYCGKICQRDDWKRVHRRECQLIQDESTLAKALEATDASFKSVTDGNSLRHRLLEDDKKLGPLRFVVDQLNHYLNDSVKLWDPQGDFGSTMALGRMDVLTEELDLQSSVKGPVDWLKISSILFGTCMVHSAIDRQRKAAATDKDDLNEAHFGAFVHNFGEVSDRVKLFAMLQQHDYSHILPDSEFPLLKMKEPARINGRLFFADSHLTVGDDLATTGSTPARSSVRCFICGKHIAKGSRAISPHQIDRKQDLHDTPRLVNYLPPRSPLVLHRAAVQQRLKAWLHIVARIKTIPKEFVCGEGCEQHSLYGRLFEAHPLPRSNREEEERENEN